MDARIRAFTDAYQDRIVSTYFMEYISDVKHMKHIRKVPRLYLLFEKLALGK